MKKVCFFGGSFDPIHLGHLNLAVNLMEKHYLEQILFCPASTSPFKEAAPPEAAKKERLEMIQRSIASMDAFEVLDFECNRECLSYTIDTIKEIRRLDPESDLYFILGEDAIATFHQWKSFEELVSLATPLIGTRISGSIPPLSHLPHKVSQALKAGLTPIPVMEISSTLIRERLKHKKYCGHLLTESSLKYIETKKLYL